MQPKRRQQRIQKIIRSLALPLIFLGYTDICLAKITTVRLEGHPIYVFNGLPKPQGWGEDLVYQASPSTMDTRTMGALGGLPLVDIWNKEGGVSLFNTQTYQEPLTIKLHYDAKGVTIEASGATEIESYQHKGDYYEAVRAFALKMQKKGLAVQPAPDWAFNANWETYGFEEDFDLDTIKDKLPDLKKLGIKTVTIDSGWYGENSGEDVEFNTGDFTINPDIIGTEKEWAGLIDTLHQQGLKVRLWWVPGVAEKSSQLWNNHRDWFSREVISSTEDTADVFLKPNHSDVINWNKALIKRFLSYGIDGFKQDDIYHYVSNRPQDHVDYAKLINSNLSIAQSIKKDFTINSCNCGIAQNFYLMSGQNQLITSDPVGSKQFRHRAKYLHALNVNGAAILGDHIELTQGDIDPDDMDKPGFYHSVDFTSVVPLGLVLQTKFRQTPGAHYNRWFKIYNDRQFYRMEWVNIPLQFNQPETYLLRDNKQLYFSFFTQEKNATFNGMIKFSHLMLGHTYKITNLATGAELGSFTAMSDTQPFHVSFTHSLVLHLNTGE
jgi:hypothetical protein